MATKMNDYTEGRVRQNTNPNTHWTDFGIRAMKTYGNAESHVGCKKYSCEATDGDTKGCNQKGTSACS